MFNRNVSSEVQHNTALKRLWLTQAAVVTLGFVSNLKERFSGKCFCQQIMVLPAGCYLATTGMSYNTRNLSRVYAIFSLYVY